MTDPKKYDHNHITIKMPLKNLLNHAELISPRIEDAVIRANEFATQGYEFIRLFLLYKFEQNKELPRVDIKFITCIFSLIGRSRDGRGGQSIIPEDMAEFYENVFSSIYPIKLCKSNLKHVLKEYIEKYFFIILYISFV